MTTYRQQTINHIKAYTLEKERILTDSSEVAGSRDGLPRPKAGGRKDGLMSTNKMFQVSTLQALAMGYTKAVITVEELLKHGSIGLGTFENVDGEMITLDGRCFRATEDGSVVEAEGRMGVPFSAVENFSGDRTFELGKMGSIAELKQQLDLRVEEGFGLNSMHMVRIDGEFPRIDARSESAYKSQHVTLKDVLSVTQKAFIFENIRGSLICVYFPDYMDGINAPGWHLHFLSEDKTKGGHVFDLEMEKGTAKLDRISGIEIQLPDDPAYDVYSLKQASQEEIKQVEQGTK